MFVGNGDAAEHCADDTEESLVGAAEEQVFQGCEAVDKFFRCTVDAAVVVSGEAADGARGEYVSIDDMRAKVGDVFEGALDDAIVPELFFAGVLVFRQIHPVVWVGEGGDANTAIFEWFGVVEVIG